MDRCFIILVLISILSHSYCQDTCQNKNKCGSCIQEPNCVWCIQPKINGSTNCLATSSANLEAWCDSSNRVSPTPSSIVYESNSHTHMNPQHIKLKLRKGVEHTLQFVYKQSENYPVDLYYIMDLSASMKPHKNRLGELGQLLADTMNNITNDFRLGFGSFVDKVAIPFTSTVPRKLIQPCEGCAPPYSFKNHLSLSANTAKFIEQVNKTGVSGNLDAPEGGFDALMQAIVCKKEIGWREKARHLIVFSTDADFHIAGDGKLAGIVEPNDGKCHMMDGSYTKSLVYDYPSVSHINYVAKQNNINIIFAIVKKLQSVYLSYDELQKNIDNSGLGALSDDSKNVVDLIVQNYNKITNSVRMTHNATNEVKITYVANCSSQIAMGCNNVTPGTYIQFNATIKATECFPRQLIEIKPEALNESLILDLEVMCSCECENPEHHLVNNQECNGSDKVCGVCDCMEGKTGEKCECNSDAISTGNLDNCRLSNETEVCSGLGKCICGQCQCENKLTGKYCECDNFACNRVNGEICSGIEHGTCECGICNCKSGWSGDSCECNESPRSCMANVDDVQVCSGNGTCSCGECVCNKPYTGKYCENCPTCPGRCAELLQCVLCQAFKIGEYSAKECNSNCTLFKAVLEEKITEKPNVKNCKYEENDCKYYYQYEYDIDGTLIVTAQTKIVCNQNIIIIILSLIGSIVLAGLVSLIIWKVFTTIHDQREFAKFEQEQENSKWHRGENPLFKQPVSKFQNPVYNQK